jgi:hypothetical protein
MGDIFNGSRETPRVLRALEGGGGGATSPVTCREGELTPVLVEGFDVILRNSGTYGSVEDLPDCTESLTKHVQVRGTGGSTASVLRHTGPPSTVLHYHRSHIHTEEAAFVYEVESLALQQLRVVAVPCYLRSVSVWFIVTKRHHFGSQLNRPSKHKDAR